MRHLILAAALAATTFPSLAPALAQPFRITLREDPDSLDPTLARTFVSRIVFAGMCDKLFDINEKLEIVPQLATGYTWADPKTLVIKLREGVLFQDGTAMDAEAVKYSLMRHLTMQGGFRRSEINAMDHVDVVDPLTVKIVLKEPSSPFLAQLTDRSGMIVSPKAAEAEGRDFQLHPVCAGPFRFVERVPQDHITLEKFPQYWDAANIHLDRVVYSIIPDSSIRLSQSSGRQHRPRRIHRADRRRSGEKQDPKLRLAIMDALGYPDDRVQRRQWRAGEGADRGKIRAFSRAFEMAIDREALIQVVYNGLYRSGRSGDLAGEPDACGHAQARVRATCGRGQEAAAGGRCKTAGGLVRLTVPNNPDLRQVGEVIQAMAGEAGFDVQINAYRICVGAERRRPRVTSRRSSPPGRAASTPTATCILVLAHGRGAE